MMPWARFLKPFNVRTRRKQMRAYKIGEEKLVSESVLQLAKAQGAAEEIDRYEARARNQNAASR